MVWDIVGQSFVLNQITESNQNDLPNQAVRGLGPSFPQYPIYCGPMRQALGLLDLLNQRIGR